MLKGIINPLADMCRKNRAINTAAQYTFLNIFPKIWKSQARSFCTERYELPFADDRTQKVAFICDEMTWLDFYQESQAIFLSPIYWRQQLDSFHPHMFFCESTWSGNVVGWPDWRGRVYRNRGVSFENRSVLLDILEYCRQQGIVTVFWNKEDPTFFGNQRYDFVDTALRFDYILTTAEECVARYQEMGHPRAYLLPFGVNTKLFNPKNRRPELGTAIFAGSWFGNQPQRCTDMERLFSYVISQGLRLDIYDRKYGEKGRAFQFPKRFQPYIQPGIPYSQLGEIFKQYEYAININTVVDSSSMCSRRVLQLAACGVKILSNASAAMEQIEGLYMTGYRQENAIVSFQSDPDVIMRNYSTRQQFQRILDLAGPVRNAAEILG